MTTDNPQSTRREKCGVNFMFCSFMKVSFKNGMPCGGDFTQVI